MARPDRLHTLHDCDARPVYSTPELAAHLAHALAFKWRAHIRRHLRAAVALGELGALPNRESAELTELLLALLNGAQVLAVLSPDVTTPAMLEAMLQRFVDTVRAR